MARPRDGLSAVINLAGARDCDAHIRRELRRARIEANDCQPTGHEVDYSVMGRLGGLTFTRAWTYWIAEGRVPLKIARALYEDPIGRDDVRVCGHCGKPPPADPWLRYVDLDGMFLLDANDPKHVQELKYGSTPESTVEEQAIAAKMRTKYRWVEDRVAEAAEIFVDCYHIDTEAGLRLFADHVRCIR